MPKGKHLAPKTATGRASRMTIGLAMGLFLVMAIPAAAGGGGPHNKATGTVEWTARANHPTLSPLPGLVTTFDVHMDAPGATSSYGDRGTITTYRPSDPTFTEGTIVIDVACVLVDGNQAWAGGQAVWADGGYAGFVGDFFVYHFVDNSTSGADPVNPDRIGGNLYGSLSQACGVVANKGFTGAGVVTSGNLKTHYYDGT